MVALFINSLHLGGAERIVLNIYNGLVKKEHDVVIICLIENNYFKIPADTKIICLTKENEYKRGTGIKKILLFPIMVIRLRRIIRQNNIRTVQSHLYSTSIINVFAKLLGSPHQVQIVNHSYVSYERKNRINGLIKLFMLRFTYRRADLIVSLTKKMQEDINLTLLKNNRVKNILIPNPHNISLIKKHTDEEITDFTFDENTKYIITAGRLSGSKRIDILITAFSEVIRNLCNCKLIILGDGAALASLRQLCADKNVVNDVFFAGHVKNPHKYIAKSDIFVLTSEREGLPNILFETMVCQTAIISTDCLTGPREILAPDSDFRIQLNKGIEIAENGILIPVNGTEQLADAIYLLFKDNELRTKLIANSYEYASHFSTDKVILEYEKILYDQE